MITAFEKKLFMNTINDFFKRFFRVVDIQTQRFHRAEAVAGAVCDACDFFIEKERNMMVFKYLNGWFGDYTGMHFFYFAKNQEQCSGLPYYFVGNGSAFQESFFFG